MKNESLVLFVLSNQADNLGDTVLNRNLVGLLRRYGRVILDDCKVDKQYAASIGVPAEDCLSHRNDLPNPRRVSGLLRLLFGPRKFAWYCRSPGHLSPKDNFQHLLHDLLLGFVFYILKRRGIRVLLLGVTISLDRMKGATRLLWRWHARQHWLFSVRDKTVFERMRLMGFDGVRHVPDLFFLSNYRPDVAKVFGRPRIVVNMRESFPNNPNVSGFRQAVIASVISLVETLADRHEFTFCYQVDRDRQFCLELHAHCAKHKNVHVIPECLTEDHALPLYAGASAIVSNRLHCLMFGVLLGIPPIILSDLRLHNKLVDAWYDYGLEPFRLDVYQSSEKLAEAIGSLLSSNSAKQLEEVRATFRAKIEAQLGSSEAAARVPAELA